MPAFNVRNRARVDFPVCQNLHSVTVARFHRFTGENVPVFPRLVHRNAKLESRRAAESQGYRVTAQQFHLET